MITPDQEQALDHMRTSEDDHVPPKASDERHFRSLVDVTNRPPQIQRYKDFMKPNTRKLDSPNTSPLSTPREIL